MATNLLKYLSISIATLTLVTPTASAQLGGFGGLPGVRDIGNALGIEEDDNEPVAPVRTSSPSAAQEELYDYSDNYAVEGGVTGAIIGGVGGCVIAEMAGEDCETGAAIGALAGAAVGAVAGSRIGERQNVYRDREASLDDKLEIAEADLADAQSARLAAQRVAQSHEQTLEQLKVDYDRGRVSRDEFEQAIAYAEADLEAIAAAQAGLAGQIEIIEDEILNATPTAEERAEAERIITGLTAESNELTVAINGLSGNVDEARASV